MHNFTYALGFTFTSFEKIPYSIVALSLYVFFNVFKTFNSCCKFLLLEKPNIIFNDNLLRATD